MPAAKLNLQVEQNATYKKRLIWRDKNRRPINLSGYSALMQVREGYGTEPVLYELSTENGKISLNAGGIIDLHIPAEDTKSIQAGVYDILLTASDGTVIRLAQGKLLVSPGSSVGV